MNGYVDALRSYAAFRGRTSRESFIRAQLVFLPLVILTYGIVGLPFRQTGTSVWPVLLFVLVVLPHAVPWAALMVRRLHDMGHSGAWAWLALIPFGFVVPFPLAGLMIWGFQAGTAGPNRYGPEPDGQAPRAVAQPGAATSSPPASATPQRDVVAELERLSQLKAAGALTSEEFEALKAETLSSSGVRA